MIKKDSKILKYFFTILFCCGFLFLAPSETRAASPEVKIFDQSYSARYLSQSIADPVEIKAGQTKTVTVRFKNVGTVTWNSSGSRFISAYTMEPRYHNSEFKGSDWKSNIQTASINSTVSPGGVGELEIQLRAPNKPGSYVEKFYLAAENHTWVKDGYFYIKINVVPNTEDNTTISDANDEIGGGEEGDDYKSKPLIVSKKSVSAGGGERIKLILGFQNLGEATWENYSIKVDPLVSLASVSGNLTLTDESWESSLVVLQKQGNIQPSKVLRETIYFRTPTKKGSYTASFKLAVGERVLEKVTIPVTVTSNAPSHYQEPNFGDVEEEQETLRLVQEPRIRVGLWKPEEAVQFISYEEDYDVYDGTKKIGTLDQKKFGILNYTSGVYSFKGGDIDFRTNNYIRLSPVSNPHAVFTLHNYERTVSWKGPVNFNKYRGAMEYRVTQDGSDLYVINDLLMEDYVDGVAENSDVSPEEYLKSQAVAQRTYAYYIKEYSNKHEARNFDVVANTGDQLYLGYQSEGLMPRFVNAAEATRGFMVTYNDDIVITPYFGNTDGRTRSWVQVWGGSNKPWLVSVRAEYDAGRSMFGHGVGMSQRDAAIRAEKEGLSWEELLKYYYTGVEIEKIYN